MPTPLPDGHLLLAERRLVGISPFEHPDPGLVAALCRAGALGVLDLGRDRESAAAAIARLAALVPGGFGVRVPEGLAFDPAGLPAGAAVVVLAPGVSPLPFRPRAVLVQVTSLEEALAAVETGADGLIVKGHESGGRVSEEGSLVLLQRIVREVRAPLWVQGGIGPNSAAACLAGGARGFVVDAQLSLLRESSVPANTKAAVAAMDGSETGVFGRHRILSRGDLARPEDTATPESIAVRLGPDLSCHFVPAGQDAAFAKPLADRFRSVESLVHGLLDASAVGLKLARTHRPLAAGSRLAAAHGVQYPIVQGPMTRVSDRAAFADAVARGGGIPFLALSLLRGQEARTLLHETAALMGPRPFGVGILGFVPPDLRDEQLALVREVRPPLALIAGGRPSQARPLEEAGIATYLHVPSPGLLDLFLKDGARRFVFEGRECGGHVGPRTSFVLWESALERLLSSELASEVSVLFAGGIHDARSGAMVSAMAAPLAARGAKVGVLMGTAYLFTEEAVTTGAIQRGFQEEALRCERTVLLETAPGHSTRCAETEYVRAFRRARERLASEGRSPQELWAELEKLNLGRLRIAAKGLKREGEDLLPVDADEQRREGMYMIGQVAALRTSVTTVASLHRDVAEGGDALLATIPQPKVDRGVDAPLDVAIVGMACVFPKAPDLDAFWRAIVTGENAITEVPPERWNVGLYFDPKGPPGEKTPSKWGGFLPEIPFEPAAWGIPPRALPAIEPVQLLALEVAKKALEDAGYEGPGARPMDREKVSVIFGAESGTDLAGAYGFRALYPQYHGSIPEALDRVLPRLTEDSFPGVLANVIAGRIANRLDLGGVNYTVDAACASSLAALDLACKELSLGTSDAVLCGGADVHNSIQDYLLFASVHALSPRGLCSAFDAGADGIVLGEGVACVVLKRKADAERDGDRIYAVIRGVAGSSDGKSLGLTAPRKEGQVRALSRAYRRAGIAPSEIGLVEAHGTGTVVGDRTELATLTEIFSSAGAATGACALGSVKSQIGHTKCAAGLAGLIKAALCVHHRVLPPTLNLARPNPAYDAEVSPFSFHVAARPWPARDRKASVSAFGFGGTNFHAVLEGTSLAPAVGLREWPAELFLFRAETPAAARARAGALGSLLEGDRPFRLRDLARSACESGEGPVQLAVVAKGLLDLREKLVKAAAGESSREGVFHAGVAPAGKLAMLFPGQGSQKPGMLAELFVAFPGLFDLLERAERWTKRLYPPAAFTPAERSAQLAAITDTRVAQPVLGMCGLALSRVLGWLGIRPDMLGGHSYGELLALCVSGAIPEEDLLSLSEARAQCILEAAGDRPGTMAAVRGSAYDLRQIVDSVPGVVLANHNAPDQMVIAGPDAAVEAACVKLAAAGLAARRLQVACAFHSPIVAAAQERFAERLAPLAVGRPSVPVWSNLTARPYPDGPEEIRKTLAAQLASPVRFFEEVEDLYAAGARVFVEAGPGGVLTDLVGRILGERPHLAIACDRGEDGLASLLLAVAQLACAGVDVNPEALFEGRSAERFDLAAPPRTGPSPTAWMVNGHRARPLSGELPDFAMRPLAEPLPAHSLARPLEGDAREGAVREFLKGMRDVVESQRQVMLRFLGENPVARTIDIPSQPAIGAERRLVIAPSPAVLPAAPARSAAQELVAIVSERTGYPEEMLDPDLDLEADLGIDSIKRIEILGMLAERLNLTGAGRDMRSDLIEPLAAVKTLRAIAAWLETHALGSKAVGESPALPAREAPALTAAPGDPAGAVSRFVLRVQSIPAAVSNGDTLEGKSFAVTNDGRVAPRLAELLCAKGATVRTLAEGDEIAGSVDGLIHLAPLRSPGDPSDAKALFGLARQAAMGGARWVVSASGLGGDFGRGGTAGVSGIAGLLKSVSKEFPEIKVRAVDLDRSADPALQSAEILAEMLADDRRVEVGYAAGVRQALELVRDEAPFTGAPADLSPDAVVLVTGGARGITARVTRALAKRYRCRLVLVGRSPLPAEAEPSDTSAAHDAPALRRAILARGELREPSAIEAACAEILAARDIRSTLAAIREAGGTGSYHSLDVRDPAAVGRLLEALYEQYGRIDGVIHGAGILEDRLLRDKTLESFARVFDTKVSAALALTDKLRDDVRFVVFFSSVSGAFGNRGQTDYAAAGDALDKLAFRMRQRFGGRVLSIDWGPWAGGGMVSEALAKEYARRGIGLIAPEEGVARFFDELARLGTASEAQVILMSATPESLS